MYVDRVGAVVVVFWSSVGFEEVLDIVFKAFFDVFVLLIIGSLLLIRNKGVKVVAGVETVNPTLYW